jgi:hypothetical protein
MPVGSRTGAVSHTSRARRSASTASSLWRRYWGSRLGIAVDYSPIDPIKALFWTAVINRVISVPIMAAMMIVVSRTHEMANSSARSASAFSDGPSRDHGCNGDPMFFFTKTELNQAYLDRKSGADGIVKLSRRAGMDQLSYRPRLYRRHQPLRHPPPSRTSLMMNSNSRAPIVALMIALIIPVPR